MMGIASEDFVTPISGKADLDVLTRLARNEQQWQDGRIDNRLIHR
jgi:hypothetical protein